MYKNNFNRSRFGGGSSFGRRHSFGSNSRRSGGSNRRGGSRGGRGFAGQNIDISKFICKAVKTEKSASYIPVNSFESFAIDKRLKINVINKGYKNPTPIQDGVINHVLVGSDVVGIANTGTGKTAAFLLPLLNKILLNKDEKVIIVVPTRELAIQIDQELIQFSRGLGIFSVCAVGGSSILRQMKDLRKPYNFIIGTPGRLKDLLERRCFNLFKFNTIVLDEADRMLDMGFINDMRFLMKCMPVTHQTLFFSATLSNEIAKLIKEFLREPVTVSVKTGETAKNVDQDIVHVKGGVEKIEVLHELLNKAEFSKVLIFGRTKYGVERLSVELSRRGFKSESIHGDKKNSKRQSALRYFKENQIQILVATDVAARGLDIPNVSHVINYDIPATYDDYVHRIGRTGRGENIGIALTFIV